MEAGSNELEEEDAEPHGKEATATGTVAGVGDAVAGGGEVLLVPAAASVAMVAPLVVGL